ncbi:spirocyclase AveC family protein [Nocardia pseudobrasiliensis]|uniref:spirocyclase AveC family protein n=1 Tax=Nocardia pseudobrasiliensis TaxID=45979 RepID=UPI00147191CD|nr:spirocyclase AveC family protein [Nocardia pseudobrasiliensis]
MVFARWVAHDGVHATASGGYYISTTEKITSWSTQGLILIVIIGLAGHFFRVSRETGHPTFLAMLCLAFGTTFWQDPIVNFGHPRYMSNRYALNVTTWGQFIPGWHSSDSRQAETILAGSGLTYFVLVLWILIPLAFLNLLTRRAQHGLASWSFLRVVTVTVPVGLVTEFIVESLWLRTGSFAYVGVNKTFAIFGGHWYQLPLVNLFIAPIIITLPSILLIWQAQRGDGQIWIWNGCERMTPWASIGFRLLATVGFANLLILITTVGMATLYGHSDFPVDTPSYLRFQ